MALPASQDYQPADQDDRAVLPTGSTDAAGRLLATEMAATLQSKYHCRKRRPGAGGNIGIDMVAKSPPTDTPSASAARAQRSLDI